MHSTSKVGKASIFRTENKGRLNKRLFFRLDQVTKQETSKVSETSEVNSKSH